MIKNLTFAYLALLLGAALLFGVSTASPLAEAGGIDARVNRPPKPTCSPVVITKTIRVRPKKTTVITTTPKHCPTKTITSSTVVPTVCVGSLTAEASIAVTRTLNWEDIDGTAASRVPIPPNYHDFSHFNPDQNKVYRSGPPPVSVGNGVQVAYANDGKFGLGALGFIFQWKSFWVLTFLDPANGITQATLRVSGLLVPTLTVPITVDRQFVQILAPSTSSNTAIGLFIEVFAGQGVNGQRLPFWLDDFVYVRRLWPASSAQSAGTYNTLNFNNLTPNSGLIPFPYSNFYFQGPWAPVSLPEYASQGTVLHYPHTPQAASITSPTRFTLTRLSLFIPQGPSLGSKHTKVDLTGYDAFGNAFDFGWSISSATFQSGPVKLDLGGDWTLGGAGQSTGFFASSGGFNGINEIRISVEETDYSGTAVPLEFWLDDFQYQIAC